MANWGGHGINLIVMFFLSPFVVHTLGKTEYGIWSLLTVITGYMGVLDLGVRASTGRYIVLYLGKDDYEKLDQTIRTSLGLYSMLGLFAVSIGIGLGWLFPAFFRSIPDKYAILTQILLPILAFNVWFSAIQGVFSSTLIAYDRFELVRAIDLGTLVVQAAGTVAVLLAGWGICGLAFVMVGCRVLGTIGNYLLARKIHSSLRIWPLRLETERLRELFSYGLAAFVSMVSFRVIGQTSLVVAGAAIDVAAAAVFSVGAMLVMYSTTFMAHIRQTLFPAIQRAVASGKMGDARWLFLRTGRLYLFFGLLAYTGMVAFAEPFIRLWMEGPEFGADSVSQAAEVMRILAASRMGTLLAGPAVPLLNAMGHVKLTAGLAAIEASLNLGLSLLFVLVFDWGLTGIAGATLVARLVVGTCPAPWIACLKIGISWWRYLRRVAGMGSLVGAVFLGICLLVREIGYVTNWGRFFGQVGLATVSYIVLATWLLVPSDDRRRAWRYVIDKIKFRKVNCNR